MIEYKADLCVNCDLQLNQSVDGYVEEETEEGKEDGENHGLTDFHK